MDFVSLKIKKSSAWIYFQDPKGLNALGVESLRELENVLDEVARNPSLQCVVLATIGKHFSVGLDIKEMRSKKPEDLHQIAIDATRCFKKLRELSIPTLALYQGATIGGAIELTAACDFRYAAEDAKLSVPGVKIGIFNLSMTAYYLSRMIGTGRASELMIGARTLSAQEALNWGLVTEIHPLNELHQAGERWCEKIFSFDSLAVKTTKELINASCLSSSDYEKFENDHIEAIFKREKVIELLNSALR